jgi:hypothetical protein
MKIFKLRMGQDFQGLDILMKQPKFLDKIKQ